MLCELHHHNAAFKKSLKTQGPALMEEGQEQVRCHRRGPSPSPQIVRRGANCEWIAAGVDAQN